MTNNNTIFVTGATGNQGGAVARALINQGFTVMALIRNIESAKAVELRKLNIQVVKGDLNNAQTYRDELRDIYRIFSVQTFMHGIEKEINQGTTLATLAKEFQIKHFLHTSVLGAELNTGVPHMDSKFKIDTHI